MARKTRKVPHGAWRDYHRKGSVLLEAAGIAGDHGLHDAAAVLSIHAGILLGDAVLIRAAGLRSAADDHKDVIDLLKIHIPGSTAAQRQLGALLSEKNRIEYTGERVEEGKARDLLKAVRRFAAWCEGYLPEGR